MNLRKLFKWAVSYGLGQGLPVELAEDMAQNWLINIAVKKNNQNVKHAYVDIMRSEYGRTTDYKKNSHFELNEEHQGTYELPEIYLTDLSSENLKKRLGPQKFNCLQYMVGQIARTGFNERAKRLNVSGNTLYFWQNRIRDEFNLILSTNYRVHRHAPRK